MPRRTRSIPKRRQRKLPGAAALKRLAKDAYFIKDPGVKGGRRAALPPRRAEPSTRDLANILASWYAGSGIEARRRGKGKVAEPDMHDGKKALPGPIKVKPVVKGLKVTRGGTFLQFDFTTNVPCWATVGVTRGYLGFHKVGNKYKFCSVPAYLGTNMLGPARTTHSIAAVHLRPNTNQYRYVILVRPRDKAAPMPHPLTGWAATRRRHVRLTVDKVHVLDDADFLASGEMYFKTQIGQPGFNFNAPGNSLDHAIYPAEGDPGGAGHGFMNVGSGDVVPLKLALDALSVRDAVEHTFSAVERDAGDYAGALNTYGLDREPDKYAGTYETGTFEANSSHWSLDIDGGTYMSGKSGDPLSHRETWIAEYARHVASNKLTDLEYYVYGSVLVYYDFEFNW